MQILVLHPGALGDIILSLPALGLLRERFPTTKITVSGNIDYLEVVSRGYMDRAVSLATLPLHRIYGPLPIPPDDIGLWTSYERIVSWTGFGDVEFATRLKTLHSDAVVAAWKPAHGEKRHVSRIFVDSLECWISRPAQVPVPMIRMKSADLEPGREWLAERGARQGSTLIALHPGGGSREKRWPPARFENLARELLNDQARSLLIIEGPAERGLGRELGLGLPPARVIFAECIPLRLLASVLSHCHAYVGNDSGISHLAAALGIPSTVVFGPTLPENWAPLGEHVTVLRNTDGCRSCQSASRANHCCLNNISVEMVRRTLFLAV